MRMLVMPSSTDEVTTLMHNGSTLEQQGVMLVEKVQLSGGIKQKLAKPGDLMGVRFMHFVFTCQTHG